MEAHLVVRAFLLCIAQRYGDEVADELGRKQWVGSAALGAHRLCRAFGFEDDGIETIAKVFQLHPHFHPRSYVDLRVEQTGERSARISIGDCPALAEGDRYSWLAGLEAAPHPALDAIAGAVNPRARCHPVEHPEGARLAWDVRIAPASEPQAEPGELRLARISRGAEFELMRRRPLRA